MSIDLPKKSLNLTSLTSELQGKILDFEFPSNPPTWMDFISGAVSERSTRSEKFEEDPLGRATFGEFNDPTVTGADGAPSVGIQMAAPDKVCIWRDVVREKVWVLYQTPFVSANNPLLRGPESELMNGAFRSVVRALFTVYDKACKFYTPELYEEDSQIVEVMKEVAAGSTRAAEMRSRGGDIIENETRSAVDEVFGSDLSDDNVTPQEEDLDLSVLGIMSGEDITDGKELVEKAIELGVIKEYSIEDYTSNEGLQTIITDKELLVVPGAPLYLFIEFDARY